MYRVKIINLNCDNFLSKWHKVGEIIDINDTQIKFCLPYVKVIKHYRIKKIRKKCPICGHIKTTKNKEVEIK